MESCGTGSVERHRKKLEESYSWLFLGFGVLMALVGPSCARNLSRSSGLNCALRIFSSLPVVFGYGECGIVSALFNCRVLN